jgi:hypothetical protein
MKLSAKQRERIDAALWMETASESERLTAVAAMESADELHGFMLEYNWDDGLAVPAAVLEHPKCERIRLGATSAIKIELRPHKVGNDLNLLQRRGEGATVVLE